MTGKWSGAMAFGKRGDTLPDRRTTFIAMGGSALMIAHQVAGKAVRDSFFLSNYPASDLPKIVIAAAGTSIIFVLLFARLLSRFGPSRIVPAGFLLSAMAHTVEYAFLEGSAPRWSIVIYLHIVALGSVLLSGFWSHMAEAFDPRSAKQVFGRITAVGTLGGIAGGLLAERVAALISAPAVLPFLAALHLSCSIVLAFAPRTSPVPVPSRRRAEISPVTLFRRAPYLILIGMMVLAGTSSAAVIDYLFRAGAVNVFGKGAPMLRFFALFYTSTQILTMLVQTLLTGKALERVGIGRTLSTLPAGVGAGALGALLIPVFPVFLCIRSLEIVLRGSMYRSAYELVYTPVPTVEKRAAKTLIDVAFDRVGDVLGGGLVQMLLWLGTPFLTSELLGIALGLAAAGFWVSMRLDAAYSALVQQRLVDRAVELDMADIRDSTTRTAVLQLSTILPAAPSPAASPVAAPKGMTDATLDVIRELRSEDTRRVLVAIRNISRPTPLLAAQLVRLLAWDDVSDAAGKALLIDPIPITGLLVDHLTNPDVEFAVHRRIPRILARCDSQLAVQGLLAGLADARFEVRFRCSRALDVLVQRKPDLKVPADAVFAAVERELQVARPIWDSRRMIDKRDSSDPDAYLDEIVRKRADQSLEHVFSLFATVLPREPVKIAFRALHTEDKALQGLAIEYLNSVLPVQLREHLWVVIGLQAPVQDQDTHRDPLGELLQSHESLMLRIDKKDGPN